MNSQIHTVEDALAHPEIFRVSVFGSARTKPGDAEYDMAHELGYELGKRNIGVVTGGGPGQMNATNEGHKKAQPVSTNSIGLTIELPWEPEHNDNLDVEAHFQHFGERLDNFMALSNAVVITGGGIGTCLELFYTLQLTQVHHICPIPIILADPMWESMYNWLTTEAVERGFVSKKDLGNILISRNTGETLDIIEQAKKAFDEGEGQVCINAQVYKITESGQKNVRSSAPEVYQN